MKPKDPTPHINVDYFEDLTGDISTSMTEGVTDIGNRIKQIRQDKGLSLAELSKMTGFDTTLLEKIENAGV